MSSFETAASKFFGKVEAEPSSNLERMMLNSPGLCLIASDDALLRRRLLACMATVEIRRQADSSANSAKSISILANGDAQDMALALMSLDSLFDANEVDLSSHVLFRTAPQSFERLGALGIVCSAERVDGTDEAQSGFPPLHFDHKVFTFTALVHSIKQAPEGSVFFLENVHALAPLPDCTLTASLRELRNLAYSHNCYFYAGCATAGTFPSSAIAEGKFHSLHPDVSGSETFSDCLINMRVDADDDVVFGYAESRWFAWSEVTL